MAWLRAVELEATQGAAFRAAAMQPLARTKDLPAARGRILAHDGTLLACDQDVDALAVHYRRLQQPPDPTWLRRQARARLPKAERRDPARLAAAEAAVIADCRAATARLAASCGLSPEAWQRRAEIVQQRVERIAAAVNNRRAQQLAERPPEDPPPQTWLQHAARALRDTLRAAGDEPPPRIVIAEELDDHVIAEGVGPEVAELLARQPTDFPGAKIVRVPRRRYPAGTLAANVLGHLGPVEQAELEQATADADLRAEDFVGRTGVEKQYEPRLRGKRGQMAETTDHSGRTLSETLLRPSAAGCDLVLTIDARLQRAAESLLDSAAARREVLSDAVEPVGGAIVVLDVHTGAVRAAATAPRFNPNWFAARHREAAAGVLDDPARPLFDRALRMALPPGSTFKPLSAVALVQSQAVDPEEDFTCRGYLVRPDQQRCEVYVRHGRGHGAVTLYDALAESCNVYFFAHAGRMGPGPLVDWAARFGFGQATGVDLPGEPPGTLPTPENIAALEGHAWREFDTQAMSIGQGSLTATPLQVARLMAALANGGRLVTPHVVGGMLGGPAASAGASPHTLEIPAPKPIAGLRPRTLQVVGEGLRQVVAAESGSGHGTVFIEGLAIAGKTGTAETGGGKPPHAWFAGYVPAERPRLVLVVVLEHGGSGAVAAGPLARRLVLQMQELGMF